MLNPARSSFDVVTLLFATACVLPPLFVASGCDGNNPVDGCAALAALDGEDLGDGTLHDVNALEADETWTAADSPHLIENNFTVPAGLTLTLEPCAVVVVALEQELTIEGTLSAVGTADEPIVITSTEERQGAWGGLVFSAEAGGEAGGELAHVHIDSAGLFTEATITFEGASDQSVFVGPTVRDSTLRGGQGDGILLEVNSRLGPDTANNTITGMSGHPMQIEFRAVGGVLDGTYEGNGDDRILLDDVGLSFAEEDITWRAISVPYLWDGDIRIEGHTVTIEPGTRIEMPPDDDPDADDGVMEIGEGGVLVAHGSADAPITFTLDAEAVAPAWYGIHVQDGGSASFDFTTFEGAGLPYPDAVEDACTNNEPENRSAIRLDVGGTLTLTNSTIRDVPGGFGVLRNYGGTGEPEFVDSNTFEGDMICGESDQYEVPDDGSGCNFDQCCAHAFGCNAEPT